MAVAYTDLPAVKFALIDEAAPNTHYTITAGQSYPVGGDRSAANRTAFLIGFDAFPAALTRNKLYGGQVTAYAPKFERNGAAVAGNWAGTRYVAVVDDFDAATVTFASYPAYVDGYSTYYTPLSFAKLTGSDDRQQSSPTEAKLTGGTGTAAFIQQKVDIIRKRTIRIATYTGAENEFTYVSTKLSDGTTLPYLRVYYDDAEVSTSQVRYSSGPNGGSYADPRNAIRFAWTLLASNLGFRCYDNSFTQASASFRWKVEGGSTWTTVSISGDTKEVTIPANTFPTASTIVWKIQTTDTDGTTTETAEQTFSTADGPAYAIPSQPIDSVQAGDKRVEFIWTLDSDSGSAVTRVELQYSSDSGSSWTTLMDVNEDRHVYFAPENTFTGGTIQWRVRAYNTDGVAGDWGTASFVCIAAPAAPSDLTVTAVPFPTVTWQAAGQQAYEIFVDGVGQGPKFGTAKTFTLDEPLADGEHLIGVSVQGTYGLWSTPAEQAVTIQNVPGDAIELFGSFGIDAELQWSTSSATADFSVFRDGARIGHTEHTFFNDRLCIGQHIWEVVNRLPNGNYSRSNSVTGTLQTETTVIAAYGSGDWIALTFTENRQTTQTYSYERTHSLRHVFGAVFPVLELAPYEDVSAGFDTAFLTGDQAKRFEALRGKVVTIKARGDSFIVGALTSIRKTVGDFYTAYSFTLQRIHWEDFTDDALY